MNDILRPRWQRSLLGLARAVGVPLVHGNTLAMYAGPGARWDLPACYDLVCRQIASLGLAPDLIGIGTEAKGMIAFDAGDRRLRKRGWSGVDSIGIKVTRAGGGFVTGWQVSASFAPELGYLFFCVTDDVARFDAGWLTAFARELLAAVDFDYGIGYRRPVDLGADLYAVGVLSGLRDTPADRAEGQRIARWFNASSHFARSGESRAQHLRDVYAWNMLSPVHLQRHVGSQPLADWIGEDPARGTLQPFVGDRQLWTLSEAQTAAVRDALRAHSLLVAYRDDVPPLSAHGGTSASPPGH